MAADSSLAPITTSEAFRQRHCICSRLLDQKEGRMPLTISADELRAAMVDGITVRHQALGLSLADGVRRALLTVPRHLFTGDDADLEAAYADKPIVTKRDERGVSLSSVS